MIPSNNDNLPSITEEIINFEKDMQSLKELEELASLSATVLRRVLVKCGTDASSLNLQSLVASAANANVGFIGNIQHVSNMAKENHIAAVTILMEEESLLTEEPETISEDEFAILKSSLIEELYASTTVRTSDLIAEENLEKKLEKLTTELLKSKKSSECLNNKYT